jgi:oxygen-independent coproporphyrinogen-3 oxidase
MYDPPEQAREEAVTLITQFTRSGVGDQPASGPQTIADLVPAAQVASADPPTGVYVHVPFCRHKCGYCDFYSVVAARSRQEAFARRLVEEIRASSAWLPRPADTAFFGGGTPTLLAADLWADILGALADHLPPGRRTGDGPAEITVEANPETVTEPLLAVLAGGGVNRISIGVQSFHPHLLRTLDRRHDPADVARSVRHARSAGIDNISLDLIFGIPGQSLDAWRGDLEAALALEPAHLSCYGLTYEPSTPLAASVRAGRLRPVDEDLEATMYEVAIDRLDRAGFEHYEISNWARPGRRCRQNLLYWNNGQWWPLGPGAAGHVAGWRWTNAPSLEAYLGGTALPPITGAERLDDDGRVGEVLMLGLRLVEGIPLERIEALLAVGGRGRQRARAIERHVGAALLCRRGGRLRLTPRGLLLADRVLADLI